MIDRDHELPLARQAQLLDGARKISKRPCLDHKHVPTPSGSMGADAHAAYYRKLTEI